MKDPRAVGCVSVTVPLRTPNRDQHKMHRPQLALQVVQSVVAQKMGEKGDFIFLIDTDSLDNTSCSSGGGGIQVNTPKPWAPSRPAGNSEGSFESQWRGCCVRKDSELLLAGCGYR